MNRSVWLRAGATMALPLTMLLAAAPAQAEKLDDDASFSLKLATALRERTFMRAGVIYVDVKTDSGEAYDVTGPVIRPGDIRAASDQNDPLYVDVIDHQNLAGDTLDAQMAIAGLSGLGAPPGVKARAGNLGTAAISIGHYLTDDFTWMVEAYVLALPLRAKIYGDGLNGTGKPNFINGKHILSTKLLPPTVALGRYWGHKDAKFRPYTGVMGMYAIFFDTKPTATLNDYMGGTSPNDTSVSLKNAFGIGPSLGFKYQFNDDWHVSFNIGSVKLKTEATLTTRNTQFTSRSAVLDDYPQPVLTAIKFTRDNFDGDPIYGPAYYATPEVGGAVTLFLKNVATERGGNLGTYVRKQQTTLNNTLMMFSVGRSF
ncbi:MAG: OmpW family outer membrane protein [Aquabacterium sp.]|uniref:OmpW/AlkL family protein n=1 Tax=Aquabacterium sp. TaxID=1872578 RepID=UPI003BAF0F95